MSEFKKELGEFIGTLGRWEKVVDDKNYILVRAGQIYKERPNFYSMKIIVGRIHDDDCSIPTCCRTEEHANAQLIAHAPDMLEMLIRIMKTYDKGTQTYIDCMELIKSATEV